MFVYKLSVLDELCLLLLVSFFFVRIYSRFILFIRTYELYHHNVCRRALWCENVADSLRWFYIMYGDWDLCFTFFFYFG